MFAKALILLTIASQALATVFITNPTASTTFSGGREATIRWQDNGRAPSLSEFGPARVSIYAGNSRQQTSLQLIVPSVNVSTTSSITFTVDPSIGPNSNEYFIRVESLSLRDPDTPQYPALAFSAKFRLDNMSGTFSPAVQAQIDGQTTAPLAGSPSTTTTGSSTSKTATSTSSSATPSKSALSVENAALSVKASWAGVLVGAIAGVALF